MVSNPASDPRVPSESDLRLASLLQTTGSLFDRRRSRRATGRAVRHQSSSSQSSGREDRSGRRTAGILEPARESLTRTGDHARQERETLPERFRDPRLVALDSWHCMARRLPMTTSAPASSRSKQGPMNETAWPCRCQKDDVVPRAAACLAHGAPFSPVGLREQWPVGGTSGGCQPRRCRSALPVVDDDHPRSSARKAAR